MTPPECIEVDELVVRTYRREDAPAVVSAVTESLEHLRPWMAWIRHEPQGVAEREVWISGLEDTRRAGGDTVYGIFEGDRVVGGTGLHHRADRDTIEIGYWVHVGALRRHIATRVSRSLTAAALELPGVAQVEICHDRLNRFSGRVPAGLGFRLVEEYRRVPVAPAESGLVHRWRLTRGEPMRPAA